MGCMGEREMSNMGCASRSGMVRAGVEAATGGGGGCGVVGCQHEDRPLVGCVFKT